MAGRNLRNNRIYNWHVFPVQLDAQISIGSSGAPTLVTSSTVPGSSPTASQMQSMGIQSITRLSTGIYQVQLADNYSSLLDLSAIFTAPVTGGAINVLASGAALSIGTVYQIVTIGTSTTADFIALGLPSGLTPAIGMVFKAAATGAGTGNGTVKAIGSNAVSRIQILGSSVDNMLNSQPFVQGSGGGYITFQTIGTTGTISAPTFTGSALGTHTHSFTPAGTNANDGPPETFTGTPGTTGATSAGTPAGTISAPTFTGTSVATDPSSGTTMYIKILLSNSSIS